MFVEILVPLGFFAMIAYIAKVIGDTRVRRKVVDSGVDAGVAELIVNDEWPKPSAHAGLKWGLVILSLGMGVLLVELFAIGFNSPLAYAILLLATGIALIGYYLIERAQDDRLSSNHVSATDQGEEEPEPIHNPEV